MRISVRGQNNVLSKKEIRYISSFFGNILLGKRLADNIQLTVYSENYSWKEMGYANPLDFDERSPRDFEILLNRNMNRNEQILTLAHEMVHVKQFARNEWRIYDDNIYRWKGQKVRYPRKKHDNLPWEKEAIQSEPWLVHFYDQHCKRNNLVWT